MCDDQPDIDEEEYEAATKDLKAEYKKILKKKGGNYGEVKRLMEKTKFRRRKWIASEEPMVSEVVLKFPCLASKRHVSSSVRWPCTAISYIVLMQVRQEFKELALCEANINSLMETWPNWCHRIIALAKMEAVNRPFIKKLWDKLDITSEDIQYPEGKLILIFMSSNYSLFCRSS